MKKTQNCIVGLLQIFIAVLVTAGLMIFLVGRAFVSEGVLKPNLGAAKDEEPFPTRVAHQPVAFKVASPQPFATPRPAGEKTPAPTVTATPRPILPAPVAPTLTVPASPQPINPPSQAAAIPAEPEQSATRLVIPALGLDAPVLDAPIVGNTWQIDHLDQKIGHLERTAAPGEAGNMVLAGHVTLAPDGRAGPFVRLSTLVAGDMLIVHHNKQTFTYRVDRLSTVKPADVSVTLPSTKTQLTLITCLNYDHATGKYADRLVVTAYRADAP